ncbi:MAG: sulfite exporter TauE/SafE family protein, partial [Anaerolineae bacterium]|nr:sulfite exporter TauE/SafE family protein [Anaerolineae bacterium]
VGGNVTQALRRRFGEQLAVGGVLLALVVAVLQFFISVYGGFFGGGIGILMLAALALAGMTNIHTMNGLKVLLATLINGVAVLRFVIAGTIFWQYAVVMIIGAILGGYGGAAYAQRLDPKIVRRFVIVVGVAMTVYFFVREYAA